MKPEYYVKNGFRVVRTGPINEENKLKPGQFKIVNNENKNPFDKRNTVNIRKK